MQLNIGAWHPSSLITLANAIAEEMDNIVEGAFVGDLTPTEWHELDTCFKAVCNELQITHGIADLSDKVKCPQA